MGTLSYTIKDPNQHYICYEFQPEDPTAYTAVATDQFLRDQTMQFKPSKVVCVPTYKGSVTMTRPDTWGTLKLLYR